MAETSDELNELQEHAEGGAANPKLAPVSFTMAVLAVILATVTLLGHRAHTEEVVLQSRVSDQWNYYQAKNIRRTTFEAMAELMAVSEFRNKEAADKQREQFATTAERYKEDQTEIEKEARGLENETLQVKRRANRLDLGEGFLEIALVVTSITLLTRRRAYWAFGGVLAGIGVAIAATAALVH